MGKRNLISKNEARERRDRMLSGAAAAEISLTEAVREMRAISGMTQEEFAKHRGVSTRVIKALETGQGNPTIATLNRIGEFYGLEVSFVPIKRTRNEETNPVIATWTTDALPATVPPSLAGLSNTDMPSVPPNFPQLPVVRYQDVMERVLERLNRFDLFQQQLQQADLLTEKLGKVNELAQQLKKAEELGKTLKKFEPLVAIPKDWTDSLKKVETLQVDLKKAEVLSQELKKAQSIRDYLRENDVAKLSKKRKR